MQGEGVLQLVFRDSSSDDNAPYTAAIAVVPDGGGGGGRSRTARAAASSHEPFGPDPSARGSAPGSSQPQQDAPNNNNNNHGVVTPPGPPGYPPSQSQGSSRSLGTTTAAASSRAAANGGGGGGGWGDLILRGASAMTRTIMGPSVQHEPYGDAGAGNANANRARTVPPYHTLLQEDDDPSLDNDLFGYERDVTNGPFDGDGAGGGDGGDMYGVDSTRGGGGSEESVGDYDGIEIDLVRLVMSYLRSNDEFCLNIIMASLKSGTTLVQGDVFNLAANNPFLIKTFLDSGSVNTDDPRVQQTVQSEVDRLLQGDPYKGDYVSEVEYLRCLCSLSSTRVSTEQMVLLRYSGFDFVKLLYDYPHVLQDNPKPTPTVQLLLRISHIVNSVLTWADFIFSLIFSGLCVWLTVEWLQREEVRSYGYWTIICYVGGYVISLVCTMRSEQGKIVEYPYHRWRYPTNKLRLMPVLPLYQAALVLTSLRYELCSEARRYFVIRYDLRNGASLQAILDGFFAAMPQISLQWYLYRHSHVHQTSLQVCFYMVCIIGLLLIVVAILSYMRMTLFLHSCDQFGFAFMSVESRAPVSLHSDGFNFTRVMPSDVVTRTAVFFACLFYIPALIWLFIALLNLYSCETSTRAFIAVYFGVTAASGALTTLLLVYAPFSRAFGFLGVPALAMQTAHFIFTRFYNPDSRALCGFTRRYVPRYAIPVYATYALAALSCLLWAGFVLFELITKQRVRQTVVDNYLDV